ncbi:MAG TPA: hypothetical protein VK154_15535 [Chitinophagales bacterium]|nr:hypothetical protein [Chitinophagales bacterium]
METYLQPIENPANPMMKLAYYFIRKRFGKVLTPIKVYAARLPLAFGLFQGKISELDKKLTLSIELVFLIRQHVAQINICEFCIDIARSEAIKASLDTSKFDALVNYKNSPKFSQAEKAALDYATELTNKKMSQQTFDNLAQYFNEREICEIVYLVASEHVYNITNIGLNIHSDMLCDISKRN